MTKLQGILIVVGSALGFQIASSLAALSADDLTDWKGWLVSALVGCANAVGVSLVALKTMGGLSLPKRP